MVMPRTGMPACWHSHLWPLTKIRIPSRLAVELRAIGSREWIIWLLHPGIGPLAGSPWGVPW